MSDDVEVLAANEAFYAAFTGRDFEAMDAIWAHRAPVACIHPGWNALRGRDKVMASWRAILGGGNAPHVRPSNATAHVLGDSAFVICLENVEGTVLIATNVFVREGDLWMLAHHQAAPVARAAAEEDQEEDDGDEEPTPPGGGMLN